MEGDNERIGNTRYNTKNCCGILAGESYSFEFKLAPNEDRIKCLKTVVAFAAGMGGWRLA